MAADVGTLQARIEYIETILAAQTSLLTQHILQKDGTDGTDLNCDNPELSALLTQANLGLGQRGRKSEDHQSGHRLKRQRTGQPHVPTSVQDLHSVPPRPQTNFPGNFPPGHIVRPSDSASGYPDGRQSPQTTRHDTPLAICNESLALEIPDDIFPAKTMYLLVNHYLSKSAMFPVIHPSTLLTSLCSGQAFLLIPLRPILNAIVVFSLPQYPLASSLLTEAYPGYFIIPKSSVSPSQVKADELKIRIDTLKKRLVEEARIRVIEDACKQASLANLQALVILAVTLMGRRQLPTALSLIGLMCRMCIQARVNEESFTVSSTQFESDQPPRILSVISTSTLPPAESWVEAETRRRVFWSVVLLDRLASVGTGTQTSLNRRDFLSLLPAPEENYTTSQPCPSLFASALSPLRFHSNPSAEQFESSLAHWDDGIDTPFSIFGCLIEAAEGLGQVQTFCLTPGCDYRRRLLRGQELDAKLRAWRSTFPSSVEVIDPNNPDPLAVMLWALYHGSTILLMQILSWPAGARNTGDTAPVKPSATCLARCRSAMQGISNLIRETMPHIQDQNPLFAFMLFISGRALLVDVMHARASGIADSDSEVGFQLHIQALNEIGEVWELGERFAKALNTAYQDGISRGAKTSQKSASTFRDRQDVDPLDLRLSAFDKDVSGTVPNSPIARHYTLPPMQDNYWTTQLSRHDQGNQSNTQTNNESNIAQGTAAMEDMSSSGLLSPSFEQRNYPNGGVAFNDTFLDQTFDDVQIDWSIFGDLMDWTRSENAFW